nr:hypothetical protein [Aeromonas hydrophila]
MDLEFLDAGGAVLAAIRTRTDGTYRHGLWYGPSLASLTKAPQAGTYPLTFGSLSFTDSAMVFTTDPDANRNQSFSFACNPRNFKSMRFSNLRAQSTYTGPGSAMVRVKILSAPAGWDGDFAALTAAQYTALNPDLLLPAGASLAHQPGVGLVASGSAPSYVLTRGVLPGRTGVLLDASNQVVARLSYLGGIASLTVGGVTTSVPSSASVLYLTAFNGQVFAYNPSGVIVKSVMFIPPNLLAGSLLRSWIELQPGESLASIWVTMVQLDVLLTYEHKPVKCSALPANQEARAQFQPQDVAWSGTPLLYPGPVNSQKITTLPLMAGRDYFWLRDGVRNVEQGYIESTVTISGIGVRRRVLCFDQAGNLEGETWSRASDGKYRFDRLWMNRRYMLVAQDDPAFGPADYNAVAADFQLPAPYAPGQGVGLV